jgi:hypothetical protein
MQLQWRAALPTIVTVGAAAALLVYGPIPQLANYHAFADERVLLGIPHWGDVLSNAGFAVVAVWGLAVVSTTRGNLAGRLGYGLFLVSLLLTSIGSSFYHWAPDNSRLVWDRLPIALACAGLLSAVRAESKPDVNELAWTAGLAASAVLSGLWWYVTESAGQGDLRPYLLLQGLPLVLVPLWQAHARAPRAARAAFGIVILLYVVAKIAEVNDHTLYNSLDMLSGHTIKHILAALASAVLVGQLAWRETWQSTVPRRMTLAPINS